jgi:hypothetical protein
MNDAAQIRRYSAAPRAVHSRFRPSLQPPPLTRLPNPRISNRERLRLETVVTPTKQTPALRSNRENKACFSNRVRADDSARRNIDQLTCRPNLKNSNREPLRLETNVTQTKQRIPISSNREKEASFFGPSRGGCFLVRQHFGGSPPAVRPRSTTSAPQPTRPLNLKNSNRERLRLEINVTQTKQKLPLSSNREKDA